MGKDEIADAIEVDRAIRHAKASNGTQYMHHTKVPLEQVDLTTARDHGQLDLFNNECEGMCGV
jgi:hypothetical protein